MTRERHRRELRAAAVRFEQTPLVVKRTRWRPIATLWHVGRNLVRAVLRSMPPSVVKVAIRGGLGDTFDSFEREDGPPVRLLLHCRDEAKGRWRSTWWPVKVLAHLHQGGKLPAEEVALLAQIERARALPIPTAELAKIASSLADRLPADLLATGLRDTETGVQVVETIPNAERITALATSYRTVASTIRTAAERIGVPFDSARILDIGTGSGYLAFALAGLGAREVIGIDLDIDSYPWPLERATMRKVLAGARPEDVTLHEHDVASLPYSDESFDIVCSMSAIEHFVELDACLAEISRVLRPGGLTHHGVDPWFGKAGGHSLCTLDFPWGHVRLSRDDLFRYVDRLRPHEANDARQTYDTSFPSSRFTLDESRRAFERAGFDIADWIEVQLPLRDPFRVALDRRVFADCRARHPTVTRRDLLCVGYTVIARRPE